MDTQEILRAAWDMPPVSEADAKNAAMNIHDDYSRAVLNAYFFSPQDRYHRVNDSFEAAARILDSHDGTRLYEHIYCDSFNLYATNGEMMIRVGNIMDNGSYSTSGELVNKNPHEIPSYINSVMADIDSSAIEKYEDHQKIIQMYDGDLVMMLHSDDHGRDIGVNHRDYNILKSIDPYAVYLGKNRDSWSIFGIDWGHVAIKGWLID